MTMPKKSTKVRTLTSALSGIAQADRRELFDLWHNLIGGLPPKNLSLPFLRRALAFEAQCKALGGPKASTIADLQRIAKGQSTRASVGARLQPGTRLVREWKGRTWTVEVTDGGFVMSGETFDSLSSIAKKITGAHWSGPRFFGLTGAATDGKKAGVTSRVKAAAPARNQRAA